MRLPIAMVLCCLIAAFVALAVLAPKILLGVAVFAAFVIVMSFTP